jgi:hypothetical protein
MDPLNVPNWSDVALSNVKAGLIASSGESTGREMTMPGGFQAPEGSSVDTSFKVYYDYFRIENSGAELK